MKSIKNHFIFNMSKHNQPILSIQSGETVVFETNDCFNNQIQSAKQGIEVLNWDHINPATGPIYIEGAKAGDTLKITIHKIDVADIGTMVALPDSGVLGSVVTNSEVKKIKVENNLAYFNEDITLPITPMIGVIGVAPIDDSIYCGEPGAHGGNMDNKKIKEGATLYLPVFQEGALFALGDVHAAMGDGEIMVSGVEIPAEVTVTIDVLKNKNIENPLMEDEKSCYSIASHECIETAIFMATYDMAKILMNKLDLSLNEAGMLLSAAGNLQICQVVDPKRTVRMEVSKTILKSIW